VRRRKSIWPPANIVSCGLRSICAAASLLALGTAALAEPRQTVAQNEPVRGIVRAVTQALISTDLQARASRIAFQEGERFQKGDVLVEFDCRKQRAELASAEAQQLEATLNLDNFKVLQRVQAAGRHDLEVSAARVKKSAAESDVLRARIDECSVVAPFDGHVLELGLHAHETPQPGKPFIGLIADGALEVDLIVSSKWVPLLTVGTEFSFTVEETQSVEVAVVSRIGAAVDPISQTIKIVAVFKSAATGVLPGMSGTGQFEKLGG
jgi:membrane fusion protein, multidrug efflux system